MQTTGQTLKVAVLGGSFDPIHLGHLHVANEILRLGVADQVWFIPSGNHRTKQHTILLDFDTRLNLIQKAIATEVRFKSLDIDRAGTSNGSTYEIMQKLQSTYPMHKFGFLIGMDILPQLPTWFRFDWLKDNVRFLIAARPGYSTDPTIVSQLKDFSYVNSKPTDVSSTTIRNRLLSGQGIQGLVPHQLLVEITRLYKGVINRM